MSPTVPDDRTLVTELLTGLGMLGITSPVLAGQPFLPVSPPEVLRGVDRETWDHLRRRVHEGSHHRDATLALANGQVFLASKDGLRGRVPLHVEWTGTRRLPADESIPADLRVDHVYLVSCKYLSRLLHNAGPARLFEGLLSGDSQERTDWYLRVAPGEYQALYEACRHVTLGLPLHVGELDPGQRQRLALELKEGWPQHAEDRYRELAEVVAEQSARCWDTAVRAGIKAERMLWRLLRVAPAPYFVLGTQREGAMRLRIDTPWDWQHRYELRSFDVIPTTAGQPRVSWTATCFDREEARTVEVAGHVEIRWSHGRFRQPPEAKVYLDTPHREVPGYHCISPP